jgi:hypothetical protein
MAIRSRENIEDTSQTIPAILLTIRAETSGFGIAVIAEAVRSLSNWCLRTLRGDNKVEIKNS